MVTHDPSAAAIADRIVFLRDGRVVREIEGGSTERVMDAFAELQPASEDLLALAGGTAAGAGV
jgi:putative ABC transport system ATP-binding protein